MGIRHPFEELAERIDPTPHAYAGRLIDWVRDVLGEHLWSKQVEIMTALTEHRYVAVKSCHSSGKSWTAGRTVAHFGETTPTGDGFCVSCYAEGTEVLTREGWKPFDALRVGPDGDLFATRNQITKDMEWQHATAYHEAWWDGEIVDLTARGVHLRVTPNHRVLKRWDAKAKDDGRPITGEIFVRADAIGSRPIAVPAVSGWAGKAPGTVRFGRYEWSAVDFAAFLGAWMAEGSLGPARRSTYIRTSDRKPYKRHDREGKWGGTIVLTQLPGTKGFGPYRRLLTRMLGYEPRLKSGKYFGFNCSELWHYLRGLGLATTKRVPPDIKDWGVEELDAFLYYFLLGDGYYDRPSMRDSGAWKAWTSSPGLAEDLQEIAQKLGGWASITKRAPRGGGIIGGRQIVAKHPSFQLCFNTGRTRTMTAGRSHYEGFVRCVTVPNESLYVRAGGRSPVWCGNTAPTDPQVKAILWQEINRAHRTGGLKGRVLESAEWKVDEGSGPATLIAMGRKPSENNAVALFGIHRAKMLIVIDEAGGVPRSIFEAIEALTASGEVHVLAIGNPDDPASHFASVCKPGSGWHVITIDGLETPNFTQAEVARYPRLRSYMIREGIVPSREGVPERLRALLLSPQWVDERLRRWGPDSPMFVSRVRGEFPKVSQDTLIEPRWVLAAQRRETPNLAAQSPRMGIDVARYGPDYTIILVRRGPHARVVRAIPKGPTTEVAGLVQVIGRQLSAVPVIANVDDDGIGGGVTDMLIEAAWPVLPLHGGGTGTERLSDGRPRFVNARSEWWWNLREALAGPSGTGEDGYLDLDSNDDELAAQLLAPKYRHTSRGQIAVESKDDMRARGLASPDRADALAYSLVVAADDAVVMPSRMLTNDINTMAW